MSLSWAQDARRIHRIGVDVLATGHPLLEQLRLGFDVLPVTDGPLARLFLYDAFGGPVLNCSGELILSKFTRPI